MEENLEIRKTRKEDIPQIKQIFATARQFMASNGNPDQWAPTYPSDEQLLNDINNGDSFVVFSDSRQIVATFVLHAGIDPTYNTIYEGQWLNDAPYATIHRIACETLLCKMVLAIVASFIAGTATNVWHINM